MEMWTFQALKGVCSGSPCGSGPRAVLSGVRGAEYAGIPSASPRVLQLSDEHRKRSISSVASQNKLIHTGEAILRR